MPVECGPGLVIAGRRKVEGGSVGFQIGARKPT